MELTRDEVINIVNNRLLDSVDGVNSTIEYMLTLLFGMFAFYTFIMVLKFFQQEKMVNDITSKVDKNLKTALQDIENDYRMQFNRHVKKSISMFREESQTDEYCRNLIFYDLSKMLASDIHINGENNLREVFSLYSTRLFIVTKLTSGKEKTIKTALRQLSTKGYSTILTLASLQDYLRILENKDDINIVTELEKLKMLRV